MLSSLLYALTQLGIIYIYTEMHRHIHERKDKTKQCIVKRKVLKKCVQNARSRKKLNYTMKSFNVPKNLKKNEAAESKSN